MRKLFNNGWHFKKTDINSEFNAVTAEKSGWKAIDIPHDWLIHQTKDLYETSTGWYKKSFSIDALVKTYKLYFEGVYMDCTVYVNGKAAGEWKYGYSSFEIDISDFVVQGENTVVVQVRHHAPNSRWYSGAGIYRNIHLITHDDAYINSDSVYFSTVQKIDNWNVRLSAETTGADDSCKMTYRLLNANGEIVSNVSSACGEEICFEVEKPTLWDTENPYLYTLEAELVKNDEVCDSTSCKVGFRNIKFDPDSGFWINGKNVKLHGVCNHHDLGCLGAAVNKVALRRQLEIMKGMGVNAIRTSHNMPAVELMEICDEMGILVDSEAFDIWELKKTDYDYARFFDDWYKKDVKSWVCRDRNHSSVIMWSIGNEIYDTHVSERGAEVTRMLRDEVRVHDFNHNAFTTIGSNYVQWDNAQKCSDEVEVSGYNYGEYLYEEHHQKYPHWCIYGSETASRVQSRNVYHFPKAAACITHADLQCSSLGNCRAGIGDRTAETSIIADRDTNFCAGQFIWTGFDYLGEPSPYSTKNAYYGQADTAGFLKDSYYLYKAAWTNEIVLHLLPYWDFNEGQLIDVMVYTNQPEVELFFNGESQGRKVVDGVYSADWQLPYKKGELKAVSYDKAGNVTAEDSVKSFGDTAEIRLTANKTQLNADGCDLIFVDMSAYDKDGVFVANGRNRVTVNVSGAGRLVGLDSGDSTDYDEYKGISKKLFGGKLLAVIQAKNTTGEIKVTVTSTGLPTAELTLNAVSAEFIDGTADAFEENTDTGIPNEIPVRKIEISADAQHLNGLTMTSAVKAKIYPENATYDIEWEADTVSGVETNIAEIEGSGNEITVKAVGDGVFRLRCFCRNGKDAPEVISELEYDISGLGKAVVNPYEALVKGTLYNASKEVLNEVTNGGVNIQREGRNMVGFRSIDFGSAGAESLTVSIINWHSNDPLNFTLWLGMPWEEGAVKVGTYTYQADFIWQTYIDRTFELPQVIKGMHDICFDFEECDKRISFGGFIFKERDIAYSVTKTIENSGIYGDSYTISENAVERIGNNVTIEFDGFNFDRGISSITICGRTHNINDSIHLHFADDNGSTKEILEFPHSEDIMEKNFDINSVSGKKRVRFVFLPGCDFDFVSFKFNPAE